MRRVGIEPPTILYRLYDQHDELLYVGITSNPSQRFGEHAADKVWWSDVSRSATELHPNRRDALDAEALAIRSEHPRHNQVHVEARKRPRRPYSRRPLADRPPRMEVDLEDCLDGHEAAKLLGLARATAVGAYASKYEDFPSQLVRGYWWRPELLAWREAHPSPSRRS